MLCSSTGTPLSSIALDQLLQITELQQACAQFKQQTHADSSRLVSASKASLCLLQAESAAVDARAVPGLRIGSQDATTCLVVLLWCPVTQYVWAAHVDQPLNSTDIAHMTDALQNMQHPQLHIAGGYCDAQGLGPRLAQAIIQQLHSLPAAITLQLLCVAAANTSPDGRPCICELVLDTARGSVHPWGFVDRGPEVPRRSAANHCRHDGDSGTLSCIWDSEQHQLVLQPFDPTVLNSWAIMRFEQMLDWPDQQLLAVLSTSPGHEPEWFCQDMRDKMQFLIRAQEPDAAERTAASTTARYSWSRAVNSWLPVEADALAVHSVAVG